MLTLDTLDTANYSCLDKMATGRARVKKNTIELGQEMVYLLHMVTVDYVRHC